MGVYRSDQAQLTFAAEAAQGGDPEMIEANVSGVTAKLSSAANAGDRSISIDTVASGTLAIGDDGAINAALLAASIIANNNSHIKKKLNNWRLSQTKSVKKNPK